MERPLKHKQSALKTFTSFYASTPKDEKEDTWQINRPRNPDQDTEEDCKKHLCATRPPGRVSHFNDLEWINNLRKLKGVIHNGLVICSQMKWWEVLNKRNVTLCWYFCRTMHVNACQEKDFWHIRTSSPDYYVIPQITFEPLSLQLNT